MEETNMKIELGGGPFPKGDGFLNVDMDDSCDIQHNLDVFPYPFDDESVEAVYSSHCLEHLNDPMPVLIEIARICKVGASVEIRVPAMGSPVMWTFQHKHCFSALMAVDADGVFADRFWHGPRRLKLISYHLQPSWHIHEFKRDCPRVANLFPDDQQIMKWIPATAHETVFHYEVQANG
jgi:ubiquinone/menaquinone biosynthesis C-methylase UbiE